MITSVSSLTTQLKIIMQLLNVWQFECLRHPTGDFCFHSVIKNRQEQRTGHEQIPFWSKDCTLKGQECHWGIWRLFEVAGYCVVVLETGFGHETTYTWPWSCLVVPLDTLGLGHNGLEWTSKTRQADPAAAESILLRALVWVQQMLM